MTRIFRRGLALAAVLAALSIPQAPPAWAHGKEAHAKPEPLPVDVGGPFALIDQTGQPVTDRNFRGRYMLVFFGYAECQGICSTGLRVMTEALDLLGDEGTKVVPILITIDPQHDTPEALAKAIAKVHPRLVGLTGPLEALNAAAKAYKVSSKPVGYTLKGAPILEHDAYIYLMGPDGKLLTVFPPILDPEKVAAGIRAYL